MTARPLLFGALSIFIIINTLPAQEPKKTPEQRKAELEQKKAELKKKIDDAVKKSADVKQSNANLKEELKKRDAKYKEDFDKRRQDAEQKFADTARKLEEGRRGYEASKLAYKFTPGQVFAYGVEMLRDLEGFTERYYGTFVFEVKSVDSKQEAAILGIGKLDYFSKPRDGDKYSRGDSNIWLATRITSDPHADKLGGRKDLNFKAMPFLLEEFVTLKNLIFVEIPETYTDRKLTEGDGTLWESGGDKSPFPIGLTVKTFKGRHSYRVNADASQAPLIKITKHKGFRTTEGPQRAWSFDSTSVFDQQKGMILATDATHVYAVKDQKEQPLRISIRLLEGEDLEKALAKVDRDQKALPAEMFPIEFQRTRVELNRPQRYQDAGELKAGLEVAHFRAVGDYKDGDYKWYLAEVRKVLDGGKVRIRYRGSNEQFDVPLHELAPR